MCAATPSQPISTPYKTHKAEADAKQHRRATSSSNAGLSANFSRLLRPHFRKILDGWAFDHYIEHRIPWDGLRSLLRTLDYKMLSALLFRFKNRIIDLHLLQADLAGGENVWLLCIMTRKACIS